MNFALSSFTNPNNPPELSILSVDTNLNIIHDLVLDSLTYGRARNIIRTDSSFWFTNGYKLFNVNDSTGSLYFESSGTDTSHLRNFYRLNDSVYSIIEEHDRDYLVFSLWNPYTNEFIAQKRFGARYKQMVFSGFLSLFNNNGYIIYGSSKRWSEPYKGYLIRIDSLTSSTVCAFSLDIDLIDGRKCVGVTVRFWNNSDDLASEIHWILNGDTLQDILSKEPFMYEFVVSKPGENKLILESCGDTIQ